jgi:DNA-binding MarR family transcriptional regulator
VVLPRARGFRYGWTEATRQSLQDVLGGLRAAGLATLDAPARGRAQPVRLTGAGERKLAAAGAGMDRAEERMLAGLAKADRDRLAGLLLRCADNLDA